MVTVYVVISHTGATLTGFLSEQKANQYARDNNDNEYQRLSVEPVTIQDMPDFLTSK